MHKILKFEMLGCAWAHPAHPARTPVIAPQFNSDRVASSLEYIYWHECPNV